MRHSEYPQTKKPPFASCSKRRFDGFGPQNHPQLCGSRPALGQDAYFTANHLGG